MPATMKAPAKKKTKNTVTIEAAGKKVTMPLGTLAKLGNGQNLVSAHAQEMYDRMVGVKGQYKDARKERLDAIAQEHPKYAEFVEEKKAISATIRGLEKEFDQHNPEAKARIVELKERLERMKTDLLKHCIAAMKRGEIVEIFKTLRNGKKKKIEIEYSQKFRQASLF